MKLLKKFLALLIISIFIYACGSSPLKKEIDKEEPVVIANDSLEYEIIIMDPGFTAFVNGIAQPRGYYSQNYLETRNRIWVLNWNFRVQNPIQYNPNIYENIIEYQQNIDYGYEVNYLLFNYFLFAQRKYSMNLGGVRNGRIN